MTPKEIFALYLGQKVKVITDNGQIGLMYSINIKEGKEKPSCKIKRHSSPETIYLHNLKLILRPISFISEKELMELNAACGLIFIYLYQLKRHIEGKEDFGISFFDTIKIINWLRSHGFDCDYLIDSGLAINALEAEGK